MSSVDELYRWAEMLPVARVVVNPTTSPDEFSRTFDPNRGWQADTSHGVARYRAFAEPQGRRAAFVRVPERQATIIVLTNDVSADAAASRIGSPTDCRCRSAESHRAVGVRELTPLAAVIGPQRGMRR